MAEPGVKLFLPYRSPSNPRAFFVSELYVNEQGWAAHQQTNHFKAFVDTILPRLQMLLGRDTVKGLYINA